MTCRACGAPLTAGAKFCHRCGASADAAAERPCPRCGLPAGAEFRYCPRCGESLGGPRGRAVPAGRGAGGEGLRAGLPWALAGAALATLVLLVVWKVSKGPPNPIAAGPDGAPPVATTDISSMSPEEQAYRLFARVMRLAEEGKGDSMAFFLPMALGAYAQLPALDADARYHLGLLQLAARNAPAALAQADTIARGAPTHLFISMLRAPAAGLRGDDAARRRAYRAFLANEAAERARQRPEYADHGQALSAFADSARAALGTRPS